MRRSLIPLTFAFLLSLMLAGTTMAQVVDSPTISWYTDQQLAFKDAKAAQRPIMIYVFDSV